MLIRTLLSNELVALARDLRAHKLRLAAQAALGVIFARRAGDLHVEAYGEARFGTQQLPADLRLPRSQKTSSSTSIEAAQAARRLASNNSQ